jgi:hypothetical protein
MPPNCEGTTWQANSPVARQASATAQMHHRICKSNNSATTQTVCITLLHARVVSNGGTQHNNTTVAKHTKAPTRTMGNVAVDAGIADQHFCILCHHQTPSHNAAGVAAHLTATNHSKLAMV